MSASMRREGVVTVAAGQSEGRQVSGGKGPASCAPTCAERARNIPDGAS